MPFKLPIHNIINENHNFCSKVTLFRIFLRLIDCNEEVKGVWIFLNADLKKDYDLALRIFLQENTYFSPVIENRSTRYSNISSHQIHEILELGHVWRV